MQRALISSIFIALICAFFSCFLIFKGWSLIGDAISHSVLPGICLAYLLSIPLSIGAFFSGLSSTFCISYLKKYTKIKEDALMGIVFSGFFALGIIMISKIKSDIHLFHIIFGNILGISNIEVLEITIISSISLILLIIKSKDFLLFCFDATQAKVSGLSPKILNFLLLILLSLIIVSAIKISGIILVIAMLITPGSTAFLITKQFNKMLLIACLISVLSTFFGLVFSFHFDLSTAPLIIVIQAIIFTYILISKSLNEKTRKSK